MIDADVMQDRIRDANPIPTLDALDADELAREPNLCVKETLKVHLAFHDDARASNYEIYYKYSSDGGNVWGGLSRLTYNSGSSKSPYMDVDYTNKDTHLIWDDDTTGNMEINYKKD